MKDYSVMTGAQINSAVGMSFGEKVGEPVNGNQLVNIDAKYLCSSFDPCNNPADAWPIIVENKIDIIQDNGLGCSLASESIRILSLTNRGIFHQDTNPLRAAMLVFLMMKDEAVNTQGEKV